MFGRTAGCPGCRAANRGTAAVNHTEECRTRTADKLEKVGHERFELETERLLEYSEEEENKKKKAKSGEGEQNDKPAASSSGEAGAEVQREAEEEFRWSQRRRPAVPEIAPPRGRHKKRTRSSPSKRAKPKTRREE